MTQPDRPLLLASALWALTVGGLQAATLASASACKMQEFGELNVNADGGDITVEAAINGHPVRLIVDTGSDITMLFHGAAEDLGLKWSSNGAATLYGVGGSAAIGSTKAREFSIAGVTVKDLTIPVAGRMTSPAAQGLLGAHFLLAGDLEFDLAAGKVRFLKPTDCQGEQVVYWGGRYTVTPIVPSHVDKRIELRVLLNGKPVRAMLDSGAGVTTVSAVAAQRLGAGPGSADLTQGEGLTGLAGAKVDSHVKVFSTFTFGDETIKNARIEIADMFTADEEVHLGSNVPQAVVDFPEMFLGADFLRSHRVYVAMSQKKIYASYVGGPVFARRTHPPDPK